MRRFLSLLAAACVACGASLLFQGSASALGGESLGCIVSPSHATGLATNCHTLVPASSYSINYAVQHESGSYTFAWTLPPGTRAGAGCTSTSDFCSVNVASSASDRDLTATVVLTQGGAQETLSSSAFLPAVCGNMLC